MDIEKEGILDDGELRGSFEDDMVGYDDGKTELYTLKLGILGGLPMYNLLRKYSGFGVPYTLGGYGNGISNMISPVGNYFVNGIGGVRGVGLGGSKLRTAYNRHIEYLNETEINNVTYDLNDSDVMYLVFKDGGRPVRVEILDSEKSWSFDEFRDMLSVYDDGTTDLFILFKIDGYFVEFMYKKENTDWG